MKKSQIISISSLHCGGGKINSKFQVGLFSKLSFVKKGCLNKQTNKQTIEGTENEAAMGRTELYCFFLFLIEVVSLFLDSNEKKLSSMQEVCSWGCIYKGKVSFEIVKVNLIMDLDKERKLQKPRKYV